MRRVLAQLLLLSVLFGDVSAGVKPKPKKAVKINWNATYYSGKFDVCKTLRVMNAVERMRAQRKAVEVFRRCVSRVLTLATFKYKFPVYGIPRVIRLFCFLFTYAFAYVADDGGVVISPKTETEVLRALAMRFAGMASVPGMIFTLKHGKEEKYVIPPALITEAAEFLFRCFLPFKYTTWVDGDVAKYCTAHHAQMLL